MAREVNLVAIIATIAEGSAHLDDTITDLILKPAHAVEPVSRLSVADFIPAELSLATSRASLFTIRRLGPEVQARFSLLKVSYATSEQKFLFVAK